MNKNGRTSLYRYDYPHCKRNNMNKKKLQDEHLYVKRKNYFRNKRNYLRSDKEKEERR